MSTEDDMKNNDNEYRSEFQLILHAGNARSIAVEAIEKAKAGKFADASRLTEEANKELLKAHEIEKNLVVDELNGIKYEFGILMMHAQDHLNAAQIIIDQASDFITIYKRLYEIERRLK